MEGRIVPRNSLTMKTSALNCFNFENGLRNSRVTAIEDRKQSRAMI